LQAHVFSLPQIESVDLPGPSAVICMADSPSQLARIQDGGNVVARLDLVFNDSGDDFVLVRSPSEDDARRILAFVREHAPKVPHVIFQCQVGIGRSLAAYAAFIKLHGGNPKGALHKGTHNRALYRKILTVAGHQPDAEPSVSLVVRVKYAPDRTAAFLLSIQRQRYDNWEIIFVADGPNPTTRALLERANDRRVKLIETEKALGRWGTLTGSAVSTRAPAS
jgi:Glycosyl transferase family 2